MANAQIVVGNSSGLNTIINPASGSVAIGTYSPPATLHVSGTSILGRCNTAVTCGAPQAGALCYRANNTTYYYCDGADSWIPLAVTTRVSASALN